MQMLSLQQGLRMPLQAPLSRKPQLIFVPPLNSATVASSVLPYSLLHSTSGIGCCKDMELCQAAPGPAEVPSGACASLTGPLSLISGFPPGGISHGIPTKKPKIPFTGYFSLQFYLSQLCNSFGPGALDWAGLLLGGKRQFN